MVVGALTLPALSVATMASVWPPSALPSSAKPGLKLKLPLASSVRLCGAPPSTLIWAPATPDRLSITWPLITGFVCVAAGVAPSRILGGCLSWVSANLASTACATSAPMSLPALLSRLVWMPP